MDSLNALEVANLLKITKNTVYELIKRGELPAYKVGRKLRIDREDVENYINNQKGIKPLNMEMPINNVNFSNTHKTSDLTEIIISGQDIILDVLAKYIEKLIPGVKVFRTNIGSYNGLYELYNNRVSISSSHLWDKYTNEYNTPFVKMLLPGTSCTLINLASRVQGFYVKRGNPKNINTWSDLKNPDIAIVNREKGAGTRILLDSQLDLHNISKQNIIGYNHEENSHLSVASYVSRGLADVGVGNEKFALQVNNIDFIPLQKERYDLVFKNEDLQNPIYKKIIDIINSDDFKSELLGIGGYDITQTGCVVGRT
jgi:putative molybdopterin biosynthesis protein